MASEGSLSSFVSQIIQQLDVPRWNAHHVVLLNPRLAYATLLMQSLAVRGTVSSKTSRWLPSFVNGEDKILRQSLSILESIDSMEAFPAEAALLLSAEQRRFAVLKLYDLMHLEGRPSHGQWSHFHRVQSALEVDEAHVAPGLTALDIKHQRSVLGEYNKRHLTEGAASAHLTWACTMLYIMVADGAIEAGHLDYVQWSLSAYPDLQSIAVRRARAQPVGEFISGCTESLTDEMKRFILLHAAQLMTLNGYVQSGKKRLFSQLLKAFRLEDDLFQQHLVQLSFLAKPVFTMATSSKTTGYVDGMPKSPSHHDDKKYHQQSYQTADQGEGVLARRTLAETELTTVSDADVGDDNVQLVERMASQVNRQSLLMESTQDNVQKVPATAAHANIQTISQETGSLRRQQLAQKESESIRQKLDREAADAQSERLSGTHASEHHEQVASSVMATHRESISGSHETTHRETLEASVSSVNRQNVASESIRDHRQRLSDDSPQRSTPELPATENQPAPEVSSRLDRWLHAWKKAITSESEVFQRKAGIRQEIPPIIHRKRIVDFSSLNIFIEYEHEKVPPAEVSNAPEQKSYSYKLKTCIQVLNNHMDVVNQKLERVEAAKKRSAVS
jgi:hypothetical protein